MNFMVRSRAEVFRRLLRFTRRFRLGYRKVLPFTPRKSLQTFAEKLLMRFARTIKFLARNLHSLQIHFIDKTTGEVLTFYGEQ